MSHDDSAAVEQVAREYLVHYGTGAVSVLIERAEVDEWLGDAYSGATWREIAAAAGRLLDSHGLSGQA